MQISQGVENLCSLNQDPAASWGECVLPPTWCSLSIAPRGGKEVGVPPQDSHEAGFGMGRQVFIRNWKSAKQCKLKHKIYTCVEVRAKHQQGSGNYREDHDSYFLVPIT